MTVYYLTRSHSSDKGPIQAFPPGLRILAGDPYSRSAADKDNIGWSCIGGKSEPKKTKAFPGQNCPVRYLPAHTRKVTVQLICLARHRTRYGAKSCFRAAGVSARLPHRTALGADHAICCFSG